MAPIVTAVGSAKSVIQPQKPDAKKDPGSEVRIPAMLKQDQPVNVTAQRLDYDGNKSEATYTGNAQLWQGETVIKAPTLVIDSKNGNLDASGSVATVTRPPAAREDRRHGNRAIGRNGQQLQVRG